MTVSSVAKTLCVLPLGLFFNGEPTVFQNGDVMTYRPHDCLCFLRGCQPLTVGEPRGDTKFGIGRLDEYQFGRIGCLLSELFGFSQISVLEKRENGWLIWNFR